MARLWAAMFGYRREHPEELRDALIAAAPAGWVTDWTPNADDSVGNAARLTTAWPQTDPRDRAAT